VTVPTSIRIWHENLHVSRVRSGGGADKLPLVLLSADDHIHGGLRIEIGGRLVPHLDNSDHDDVCFMAWIRELQGVTDAFVSSQTATYLYDQGEEGQPGFLFQRRGDRSLLSVVDSQISDEKADPAWQCVEFATEQWLTEHAGVRKSFFTILRKEASKEADQWIQKRCLEI
jgi:hypothetical protein